MSRPYWLTSRAQELIRSVNFESQTDWKYREIFKELEDNPGPALMTPWRGGDRNELAKDAWEGLMRLVGIDPQHEAAGKEWAKRYGKDLPNELGERIRQVIKFYELVVEVDKKFTDGKLRLIELQNYLHQNCTNLPNGEDLGAAAGIKGVESVTVKNDTKITVLKKRDLVNAFRLNWERIETDLKHANKFPKLQEARSGARGWNKEKAQAWAQENGRWKELTTSVFSQR